MIKHLQHFFFFCTILIIVGCETTEDHLVGGIGTAEEQSESYISLTRAEIISENIVFEDAETKQVLKKNISDISPIKDENENNLFYIINYVNGGYVILAADNRSIPILAYSESNSFNEDETVLKNKAGISQWVKFAEKQILEIRQKKLKSTEEIDLAWKSFESQRKVYSSNDKNAKNEEPIGGGCQSESEQVSPLLQTTWNQGCGYNDLLPLKSCTTNACGRVYAGCVPVAIAQLMRFHEYPNTYNWSAMGDTFGTLETSTLIKDIHDVINEISYNCDGTGVDSDYGVAGLFKTEFGYSYASQQKTDYYQETTKSNLRKGQPVILAGFNSSSGHMWVCDGFRSVKSCLSDGMSATTLTLHMNWGWGGQHDGWYSWNNFNPNSTYNQNNRVYYNIKP